jgi:periplasmic protein TonB
VAASGIGTGTGPVGGGVTERFYNRYLSQTLEQSIRQKDGVNRRVFTAQVDIWISGSGSVTKAALAKSTGDKALDANLVAALEEINGLSQPPATLRFPQRIRVRGSRGA